MMWLVVAFLIAVAVSAMSVAYVAQSDAARARVGVKLAEWSFRIGGTAVMDYNDLVRLQNVPSYGHRVYTSPDGRVLVIDPVDVEPVTFTEKAGAVQLPKRVVVQVTSYGQFPSRAELSQHEAFRMTDSVRHYLKDSPGLVSDGAVPQSQR